MFERHSSFHCHYLNHSVQQNLESRLGLRESRFDITSLVQTGTKEVVATKPDCLKSLVSRTKNCTWTHRRDSSWWLIGSYVPFFETKRLKMTRRRRKIRRNWAKWLKSWVLQRLKALFLSFTVFCSSLIGLHEPPIRILAQMAKNLQTTALNNISFQHRCRINSNTTCVSFFAAWYQTKLAQFLFFRTTKMTFFFQYLEHMQHLGPRTLTDGPTIGQLGPICFISWSFVVVISTLYRIYSNHGYVTLLRFIICWIYTFCTFYVVQTPSLIVC